MNNSYDNNINTQYEECCRLIEQKDYKSALAVMEKLITDVEDMLYKDETNEKKRYFCFNHILDTYYYVYFFKDTSKLNYADYSLNVFYAMYGSILLNLYKTDEAIIAYNKSTEYNPVDLDIYFQLGELYKKTGNLHAVWKVTLEAYNFCCSRATMAHFYRNLGYYYLESMKPDIAKALYLYSNIFYETKQANSELEFIENAASSMPNMNDVNKLNGIHKDVKELQKILGDNNIPLGPNSDTIGITYRVAKIEEDNGNYQSAFDCFSLVYDLTMDEEVMDEMSKLKRIIDGEA